jgi:SecD/SecF fusion protein
LQTNINGALNSTLGRTINTTGTTLITVLVMFIFGGEIIRGFMFALFVGIFMGTYSSVFNATPIVYDLLLRKQKKAEALEKAK